MRIKLITPLLIACLSVFLLSGCYKDDLDEFKKASSIKYQPEMAFPFVIANITLEDTIDLPASYSQVRMADTASVEIPQGPEKDSLESLLDYIDFRIQMRNSFPYGGVCQLYFADSNGVFIDSLLNSAQRVVDPGSPTVVDKELNILVDKARYLDIQKNAAKMYLFYDLTSTNTTGLEDDSLTFKIGIKAKLNVNLTK